MKKAVAETKKATREHSRGH